MQLHPSSVARNGKHIPTSLALPRRDAQSRRSGTVLCFVRRGQNPVIFFLFLACEFRPNPRSPS